MFHHFRENVNKCLLIPNSEPITDPSTDTTEVHFGELMSFIGVIYSNMGEGLLKGT